MSALACIPSWLNETTLLAGAGALLILAGVVLSFITRFVQFRAFSKLPEILSQLQKPDSEKAHLISPIKALFTAMSTTIGIASIVAPVVAIKLGGPGALLGFFLTMIFGSATTFTEVTFALKYRTRDKKTGEVIGGPMAYLTHAAHPALATWYAFGVTLLLTALSANQSNTIADVLQPYGIAAWMSGLAIALVALIILWGGIQRVSKLAEIVIPVLFCIFVGGSLWIIGVHIHALPQVLWSIITNSYEGTALAAGCSLGGFVTALRWGILKGVHTTESGIGTSTIPHAMAATHEPKRQGLLAMISVWSVGCISLLSGLVVLCSGVHTDPTLGIGINVLIEAFAQHFSHIGRVVLTITAFLKAFATIVGNCYNAGQCLSYLAGKPWLRYYYVAASLVVFIGSTLDITFVWSCVDILIVPIALPHIYALIVLALRERKYLAS